MTGRVKLRDRPPVLVPTSFWLLLLGLGFALVGWLGLFLRVLIGESWLWVLVSISIGGLAAQPIYGLLTWSRQERERALVGRLPRSIHVQPGPDGNLVAIVQRADGDVLTVVLPDGYNPHDDDGEALIRSLLPEELRAIDLRGPAEGDE